MNVYLKSRFNKLIQKAGAVVGVKLDTLDTVANKRMSPRL